MSIVERVWFGRDGVASAARAALRPASALFGAVVGARNALYDAGVLRTHTPALPCVSVGNLTVGGTGKTPVAAMIAARLGKQVRPAIVLRGYGGDETEVHRRLNPGIPVVPNADRIAGVRAAKDAGAQVVVLDDAFQHRRIARIADIVLLSVEQFARDPRQLLPGGPWRESLTAARRADLVVLTRKRKGGPDLRLIREQVNEAINGVPTTVIHLAPGRLERLDRAESLPLDALRGATVVAIAGIGVPEWFDGQLRDLGARTTLRAFRDHHAYTADEARALAASVPAGGLAVCTLKDAVKLSPLWPTSSALWYVSQRPEIDVGAEEDHLERLCARVIERVLSPTAG